MGGDGLLLEHDEVHLETVDLLLVELQLGRSDCYHSNCYNNADRLLHYVSSYYS
jgi:hypothetical protein